MLIFEEIKQFFIMGTKKLKQSELMFQFLALRRERREIVKGSCLILSDSLLNLSKEEIIELNELFDLFPVSCLSLSHLQRGLFNCDVVNMYLSDEYYDDEYIDNFEFHCQKYEDSNKEEEIDRLFSDVVRRGPLPLTRQESGFCEV
jgi:hypothetical protein